MKVSRREAKNDPDSLSSTRLVFCSVTKNTYVGVEVIEFLFFAVDQLRSSNEK